MRKSIAERAKRNGRSMNSEVIHILEQAEMQDRMLNSGSNYDPRVQIAKALIDAGRR
ncbi:MULTISPECIES: Arc family DNA-binding protein [Pantoea]|jgi:hypothetical protein|uniref:Arc family DNA-binding protein n=1 Tax=Pantoea TaxID=53335 RepID=UPI001D7A7C8C|nr:MULTISPECIES: Arc family DNA-binding protein [Pantoea]MBZ6388541.1 Arc family DNA-binding protein [Pantoea piersonii]MBZ6402271.1 Arc family DNA-binding protein [Pantoea piersonii]MBZ6410522.1 Arc family DNA-binding protein [Pantoea piersonii]MBZ6427400.1 Arc family DNA-binding protein [Pantoea piersonii]